MTNTDIVLTAFSSPDGSAELQALLEKADQAGATVILFANGFANTVSMKRGKLYLLPSKPFERVGDPERMSIETMSNVIGMWGWTAEFIGACVAQGKMPCVYQSYGMPGGRERGEALRGFYFHDMSNVRVQDAKDLGLRLLKKTADSLNKARIDNKDGFVKAASMLRDSRLSSNVVHVGFIGHLYPQELQQPQTPSWFRIENEPTNVNSGDVIVYLGYQAFPWSQLKTLTAHQAVVMCSLPAPAEFTSSPNHVYLNPFWEIPDGCLDVEGYDVPLIPLSGIMDTAIYWQLVDLISN
ncbi:MAG: hypothetical protein PHR35_07540 [Kiritimatiellae bacterium]|nr:hypothetical protein [Kiritimatiellia bacterium]